jgi:hypothetical protein
MLFLLSELFNLAVSDRLAELLYIDSLAASDDFNSKYGINTRVINTKEQTIFKKGLSFIWNYWLLII